MSAETINLAAEAVAELAVPPANRVVLSNGITLKLKPVPPLLLNAAANKLPAPVVPKVHIEDDDRWEDNPSDPDYLAAAQHHAEQQMELTLNAIFLAGTEIESIPEGVEGPDADGWLEVLELVGLAVDTSNRRQRYLAWLRYYALATKDDLVLATTAAMKLAGLTEGEVAEEAARFRRDPERGADRSDNAAGDGADGDSVHAGPRGVGA